MRGKHPALRPPTARSCTCPASDHAHTPPHPTPPAQLAWTYLSALLAHKAHRPAWGRMVLLQCAVWALLGFIAGSSLASPC